MYIGADQLCGHCTADVRSHHAADLPLNFCICQNRSSHDAAQI